MVRVRSINRVGSHSSTRTLSTLLLLIIIALILTYSSTSSSSDSQSTDIKNIPSSQSSLLEDTAFDGDDLLKLNEWEEGINKKIESSLEFLKNGIDVKNDNDDKSLADIQETNQKYEKQFNEIIEKKQALMNSSKMVYNAPEFKLKTNKDGTQTLIPLKEADFIASNDTSYDSYNFRENATFVSLVRNSELDAILSSIQIIEDRFNHNFHYSWVFLNDKDFTPEFKLKTASLCSGQVYYGKVPTSQWSYPEWLDENKIKKSIFKMESNGIKYGGSVSYRHMCRYQSGFFWRHPLMNQFKYYWRIEPNVKIFCSLKYDIFKFMNENKKKYGFTMLLLEIPETIPTLWKTTKEFLSAYYPHYLDVLKSSSSHGFDNNDNEKGNLFRLMTDDDGDSYSLCHFWSNFEVADLDFWRSKQYQDYFNYLDQAGGFFYERWGDAPVHSIAASIFLKRSELHYFDDIGYFHSPFYTCPHDLNTQLTNQCLCENELNDVGFKHCSCVPKYYMLNGFSATEWDDISLLDSHNATELAELAKAIGNVDE